MSQQSWVGISGGLLSRPQLEVTFASSKIMRRLTKILSVGTILFVVFGVSFFLFYKRSKKKNRPTPVATFNASKVINQKLPKTNLVNASGQPLEDEKLRHGKVILVFMMPDCAPCDQENDFLKTIVDSRKDVRFFFVIPFGNKNLVLKSGQSKYTIDPVYDIGSNMARTLEINQVPIKVFLEGGIIKRTWVDATVTAERQAEFKSWLNDL